MIFGCVIKRTGYAGERTGFGMGEQTELVLKNLGYTDEQVAAMIAAGEAVPMDPSLKD